MSALLDLAARCESADGPDWELDAEIAVSALGFFAIPPKYDGAPIGYGYLDSEGREVRPGYGGKQLVRDFTASIDAALTLVPESFGFVVHGPLSGKYWAGVSPGQGDQWHDAQDRSAATPALALCAAALRARAGASA